MARVRKTGVAQRLNVVAQMQFVSSDCPVDLRLQRPRDRMLEVNAATGTQGIRLKVSLQGGQIIGFAAAVRIVPDNDSLRPTHVVKSPQCFVHPDFSRQTNARLFRRQSREMQYVEIKPRVAMLRDPFSGDFQSRLVLPTNFLTTTGRRIDDSNHFNRTLRVLAEPERFQTSNQIRFVETRNDDNNSKVRFRRRGDLPIAESKASEIKVCLPR